MSIFNLFRKKKPTENLPTNNKPAIPACFDKVEYQFESAMASYCQLFDKKESELTDDDHNEISRYAGNHIGFFLTWIIQHHFVGSIHDDDEEAVSAVCDEKLLGVDFLIKYCDGKLYAEDMSDDILPFAAEYYENSYMRDYSDWVFDELNELPLEFIGSWDDYHKFEHIIDRAYETFLHSEK